MERRAPAPVHDERVPDGRDARRSIVHN